MIMVEKYNENFLLMWYLRLSFTDVQSMANKTKKFLIEQIKEQIK